MKFINACKIFFKLLKADEWYVIAGNRHSHYVDAKIKIGTLQKMVTDNIDDAVTGFKIMEEVTQILNP